MLFPCHRPNNNGANTCRWTESLEAMNPKETSPLIGFPQVFCHRIPTVHSELLIALLQDQEVFIATNRTESINWGKEQSTMTPIFGKPRAGPGFRHKWSWELRLITHPPPAPYFLLLSTPPFHIFCFIVFILYLLIVLPGITFLLFIINTFSPNGRVNIGRQPLVRSLLASSVTKRKAPTL